MSTQSLTAAFLERLMAHRKKASESDQQVGNNSAAKTSNEKMVQPSFSPASTKPIELVQVKHPDGRMSQYPPPSHWNDWTEWDSKSWPEKVARRYTLVPTICFNCEAACGLLAYVDKETHEVRKFEGNPEHPGSRGRNCAKGPATHNQIYDPERILHPLKRVGPRGGGEWKRISWDQALDEIAEKMRASRAKRRDGIMYHVGRPGDDHFTNRVITAWGVDGHNSHTNICSAAARAGYTFWSGGDRPSPDYSEAQAIILVSAHLESGHYFNPHAQRIMEAREKGAKIIVLDPRLSNTAARADNWLPTWPGSEQTVLLSIASYLIQNDLYDKDYVRRWVNWEEFLSAASEFVENDKVLELLKDNKKLNSTDSKTRFEGFDACLKELYSEFTFERAAKEARVSAKSLEEAAEIIARAGNRVAAHTWRSATMGNRGGWQVARCLFFLNVLTGSVGVKGGTSLNSWNKFVPKPFKQPPPFNAWNELHLPHEWPFAMYEMSFLLPHFLEEDRGDIDVYFSRVYNPLWINPDGFMWMQALQDEEKMKCHVALTPTWNESAWFADYVLPMGHSSERHDLMSQETHAGTWIGFRQPVKRVALERAGTPVEFTWMANPGEVWEEAEFWIQLSAKMDPDGSLGIRQWFESPYRKGEIITINEYFQWIFENSIPGLPEAAAKENLSPLQYMRKYGAFEIETDIYAPYEATVEEKEVTVDAKNRVLDSSGKVVGVEVDDVHRVGFNTPSRKLEIYSQTVKEWGWPEQAYVIPWTLKSHVHPDEIEANENGMLLLPTFRLPTLIHTRSANAKWLYEISHKNPVWMHPTDAERLQVKTGDFIRIETEIGYFVDSLWVTEAIKPGIVAMSHHLGRWRLKESDAGGSGMSNLATLNDKEDGTHSLHIVHGAQSWKSSDPDTSRIWWDDVGVHQNLTHAVHPDPVSGAHCWHQKVQVTRAGPNDKHGDVFVDTKRSMEVYREWLKLTRSALDHSPDGTRRPKWFKRPLRPVDEAFNLPSPKKS